MKLENLSLKKELFDLLGLPFIIKFSSIKKLHVRVPYRSISSQPVELVLKSLVLVIAPLPRSQWVVSDTWSYDYKRALLQDFVLTMAEKLKSQGDDKNSKKDEESYWDRRIIKILDNVQITIRNIHLRYEDDLQIKDCPFSLGFTLKELSIKTTNASWETSFFDRLVKENRDKPLFKMLTI